MPYLESSGGGGPGGRPGHTCPSLPPTPFPIFGFTAVVKAWDLVIFSPSQEFSFSLVFFFPDNGGWMGRVPTTLAAWGSLHQCQGIGPSLPPASSSPLCLLPTGVKEQSGRQDLMGRKQDEVGGGESWIFFPFFFFPLFFSFFFFFYFLV